MTTGALRALGTAQLDALTTDQLAAGQQLFNGDVAGPQLAAVTEETDLVTLGLGGNDFGIFSSLM